MEKKIQPFKQKTVKEFAALLTSYPIIGLVNVQNLPSPQLQVMRQQLRNIVLMKMTKKTLLTLAFEQAKAKQQGIEQLLQHLQGLPALLFTKENPFKLYKLLQKSKSAAPAKPGQKAPKEVVIPPGPTPFAPGPIISELGKVGIKAGIEGGKVVIKQESIVAREGDVISAGLAAVLAKLGIEPMEIGLDLVAVYEKGMIYEKKILAVDDEQYRKNIIQAHTWAFNLAFEIAYPTKDTIQLFVQKAFRESKAVALEANIMADMVAKELVEKAERQMLSLKSQIPNVEAKGEEKKEGETPPA
ncbi:50S ribosomal protein L10 [Candidatus Woesearchaeota archaeon]|nr:50S ribosomal protein L10 [Candidatus Woesearchaeota archaeon]